MTDTISTVLLAESLAGRAVVGLMLSACVAVAARAARTLSWSGVAAAVACGTASAVAGWGWAAVLIGYFVTSSLVSRIGRGQKDRLTAGVVAKGGARDWLQVLANGGVYSAAALAYAARPAPFWTWAALGALAASASDTWATELGVLAGRRPKTLLGRTYVPAGMSGGITTAGLAAALAGAAVVAIIAITAGFPHGATFAALPAGWVGSIIDSLLGASLQQRRRCDACGELTELHVHACGTPTRHIAGLPWVNNDVVNLLATITGFFLSAALFIVTAGLIARSAGVE